MMRTLVPAPPPLRFAILLAVGAWALIAATSPARAQTTGRVAVVEQVLVKVNGDILTKTELENRQVNALRQRGQQLSDEELKKAIAEITPDVLVDTIDEMLLIQKGRELGYKLSDEQFKKYIERIKEDNKFESDEQFQAALKAENLSMAELRSRVEISMITQTVIGQEVMSRISVSEDEARRYYAQHTKEFTTPASLTLREILVKVAGDAKVLNVGLDEEAKQKAEAARARVVAGESFEKVAAETSDAPSKANGGLIGPINKDELAPALRDMVDKLKIGGVSEVIRIQGGYYFFKLDSMSPTTVLSFEEARSQISDRVANEKRNVELQKYLQKLRALAIIEWKNPELKKLYDQRIATTAPTVPGN
jgi:parvulin-like peptidyl-prolyl isomerase